MAKKPPKNQLTLAQAPQSYTYIAPEFSITVPVTNEDVWLSQKQIAQLFGADVRTVSYHIKALVESGEISDSVIQEIRITANDGKDYTVSHYGLDAIIPIGYRVGSSQAAEFRKWANSVLKQYLLLGYAINEKRVGSKDILKMEDDLAQLERHKLMDRPEAQRLSLVYENKKGAELLWAIINDVCLNPDFKIIKGMEYRILFGVVAADLKKLLGSDDIRGTLPDRQLKAFTLAETTLREILSVQKDIGNERVLEGVRIAFQPIGAYLRATSEFMGVNPVTNQPLLPSGKAR